MARGLSLVSLLAALAAAGWLLSARGHSGPDGRTPAQEIGAARRVAAALSFQQAQTQLEQFHALRNTYAGASVADFGVTLARADAGSYCLQARDGSSHLDGPGGTPAGGPC